MKKIFSIVIFSIVLLGCSKSFLDKQPEDTLSPGAFFKTAKDIKTGVVGVYAGLNDIFANTNLPHILGQMSDDGTMSYQSVVWHTFFKNNSNSAPQLWAGFYKMIVNANNIIDIIDKYVPINNAESLIVKAYRGEACFLRAFAYFYLVRLYGDVPMVTHRFDDPSSAFGIGRTPVNEIYNNVIIPDLESAFADCYKKGDPNLASEQARATKGAALTILAKVYLTMNDYSNAASVLKRLIVDNEAGTYSLLADYSKIWMPINKFSSESIFEINYNVGAGKPSYYFRNMTINSALVLYGLTRTDASFTVGKNLMDEFVAYNDLERYRLSVDSSTSPSDGLIQPTPLKLMPPLSQVSQYDLTGSSNNFMVTRYADALLMYAEALMQLGQKDLAVSYVNQVRARVHMPDITASQLDIDRILHERRMELAFEGHRYFDLVRTGKAVEYISRDLMNSTNDYENRVFRNGPVPEYQLILPIPVTEIQKDNTLTQNVGY